MNETFVVYPGEEVIAIGTAKECADALGVKESTIRWYASPACRRRNTGKRRVAERIEA